MMDDIYNSRILEFAGNIPRIGTLAVPNVVPRLSETPGRVKWLGPSQGAHAEHVYKDRLGLDDAEIARLQAAGVL